MSFAVTAAYWVACFYPGTKATVQGEQIALEGGTSPDQLKHIWHAALLNERLHAQNEERRRELLAELTQ